MLGHGRTGEAERPCQAILEAAPSHPGVLALPSHPKGA